MELEDFRDKAVANKAAIEKRSSKTNAKALNGMKQRLSLRRATRSANP